MNFAIVGAGMSGLACADALSAAGHSVTLFDKGRGAGGRMVTRRLQTSLGEVTIDHGAQYFTARDPTFKNLVREWQRLGTVAPWPPAGPDAWIGVPGMNAPVKTMASSHAVAWGHLVTGVIRRPSGWSVLLEKGKIGQFDTVVLALPAEQAANILALHDLAMTRIALTARSQPCWTGMFVFDGALEGTPAVFRNTGIVAWATRNSAKPGRPEPESWVVQANAAWSRTRLEDDPSLISELLLAALSQAAGTVLPMTVAAVAHRWRYALSAGTGHGALWNSDIRLGVCGDWLLGPRIECAWLSGRLLAQRCLASDREPVASLNTIG